MTLCLGIMLVGSQIGHAGWLLDERGFHISSHGQISCQDCHVEIPLESLHPDPGEVNRRLSDFFSKEECLVCHDDVEGRLEEGFHGSIQIQEPGTYLDCISCHDPHYQERLGDNRIGRFQPDKPRTQQCGACHEVHSDLPPLSAEDESCMSCHRSPLQGDPSPSSQIDRFCFHCHASGDSPAQTRTGKRVPLIDPEAYESTPHAEIACVECHVKATQYPHSRQRVGACTLCHVPHDEKVAHDAHLTVHCGACHLKGVEPVRNPASGNVVWTKKHGPGEITSIHHMVVPDRDRCRACHTSGNDLGAPSMVLPPKSILCIPCHAATFSVGDTITILALIISLAGVIGIVAYWSSGSVAPYPKAGSIWKLGWVLRNSARYLFSSKILSIARALFWDVLLQRRLYRLSKRRWMIHSLIFWPFVIRFVWGIIGLIGSLWKPEWATVWIMLDKNAPIAAFLFDLTGIMLMLGVGFSWIRGAFSEPRPPGLPRKDYLALALIEGIVGVGFILEGMRIAMTGSPPGSEFAFLGHALSRLFTGSSWLTDLYGYIWYVHAVLTGMFIAYVPFSRLFHIITAPIVLAMNATDENGMRHIGEA